MKTRKMMSEDVEVRSWGASGALVLPEALSTRWESRGEDGDVLRRAVRDLAGEYAGQLHETLTGSDQPSDHIQIEVRSADGVTFDVLPFDFSGTE